MRIRPLHALKSSLHAVRKPGGRRESAKCADRDRCSFGRLEHIGEHIGERT